MPTISLVTHRGHRAPVQGKIWHLPDLCLALLPKVMMRDGVPCASPQKPTDTPLPWWHCLGLSSMPQMEQGLETPQNPPAQSIILLQVNIQFWEQRGRRRHFLRQGWMESPHSPWQQRTWGDAAARSRRQGVCLPGMLRPVSRL